MKANKYTKNTMSNGSAVPLGKHNSGFHLETSTAVSADVSTLTVDSLHHTRAGEGKRKCLVRGHTINLTT